MDLTSPKYKEATPWMTFFTPTFNRRATISRCYESLLAMKRPEDENGNPVEFEWIIVDDGSSDNTREVVEQWCAENRLPIIYRYQENGGKHVASNVAAALARGEVLANLDSDDTFLDNALTVFYKGWTDIPAGERHLFKGVTARCKDPYTGKIVGSPLPRQPYHVHSQDMRFKDKVKGEMCGFNRVDVLREFPFPVFKEKTCYCPEAIVWFEMGKKYLESIIDVPVRDYYRDAADSITMARSANRSKANYHLWKYEVNNLVGRYLLHCPVEMMKAVVGMSMDGLRTGRGIREILGDVDSTGCRILVGAFVPAGWILSHRK